MSTRLCGSSAVIASGAAAAFQATPNTESRVLNRCPQNLQMCQYFVQRLSWKDYRELFTAHAISHAASAGQRQLACHHAEYLVSGIVSMRVIERLEVVDINCRDYEWVLQMHYCFVEGASAGKSGQLVVVGQPIRIFHNRRGNDQPGCAHISSCQATEGFHVKGKESSEQRPRHSTFNRFVL